MMSPSDRRSPKDGSSWTRPRHSRRNHQEVVRIGGSEESLDITPESLQTRRVPDSRRPVPIILLTMLGICIGLVDSIIYKQSEQNPPVGFANLPTWTLVTEIIGFGCLVGVAGVALLWTYGRKRSSAVFVASVVCVTALVAWALVRSLEGIPVPAYLDRAPGPKATAVAAKFASTARPGGTCVIVSHDPLHILPTPYRRCAYNGDDGRFEVDFNTNWNAPEGDTSNSGFIFAPAATQPGFPDTCIRHLEGPWWAEMNIGDPARACPFTFELKLAP